MRTAAVECGAEVYHRRRDDPGGTAAWQEAPQEAAEPATVQNLAGDRCSHWARADHRVNGACSPWCNQSAARPKGGTDSDGQRAGAAAGRDGHSAPARPDCHRHRAAAGPDRHRSMPAPRPRLRRCVAFPVPARSTNGTVTAGETGVTERVATCVSRLPPCNRGGGAQLKICMYGKARCRSAVRHHYSSGRSDARSGRPTASSA